jgi:putative ABC transport system permease protein
MFRSYLIVAWRNLIKNRTSSFINIAGLSVGMAVAMLIACWIYTEWSYDRQFTNYDRIAQVWELWSGGHNAQRQLPAPVAIELRAKFGSNFKQVFRSSMTRDHILAFGEKQLVKAGNFIEPAGLDVLTLPMLKGTRSALNDPHSILLSSSLAKALFADTDPVGKVLSLDDTVAIKVTGVYADFPYNSTFRDITFLAPWDLFAAIDPETIYNGLSWGDNNWQTFVQLADHTDIESVSAKIRDVKAINDPFLDSAGHNQNKTQLFLYPMSRWHLFSEFRNGDRNTGRIEYVRLFGVIGVLVLLLACINFMNLSTARSEKRAKEVGVRKVLGSLRSQLIGQFFSESLLVALLSLVIALGLVQLSLPLFNTLAETQMSIPWLTPGWWAACIGFTLFTGLIAGSYPALYLSSFRPVGVLKGIFRAGRLASLPRKVLVVMQFTVSIAMIIGTTIVFRQVQYARDRPVGYEQARVVMLHLHTKDIPDHFAAFRNDLLHTGAVTGVAQSVAPVTESWPFNGGLTWTGHLHPQNNDRDYSMKGVTQDYASTVGLQFTEGRNFRSGPDGSDANTMLMNEAAVKEMGMKDPIGKTITWQQKYTFTVIGVVRNVVMESPYESPIPALYYLQPGTMSYVTIKIGSGVGAQDALHRIAAVFTRYSSAEPFDYQFADQTYDAKFRGEVRIGQLAGFFTILAIFISCLGLFGLASFVAEQRTKEISVRKVLGASIFNLWKLLSTDFVLLVSLSCLIAVPIAWWSLHQWLQQYDYRTSIPWWIFVGAALVTMALTLLTVSYQAVRAARADPAKNLRSE